jgi:hypothetical protein
MGKYWLVVSIVAFYGGIGVFLVGRFLVGVFQFFKCHQEELSMSLTRRPDSRSIVARLYRRLSSLRKSLANDGLADSRAASSRPPQTGQSTVQFSEESAMCCHTPRRMKMDHRRDACATLFSREDL